MLAATEELTLEGNPPFTPLPLHALPPPLHFGPPVSFPGRFLSSVQSVYVCACNINRKQGCGGRGELCQAYCIRARRTFVQPSRAYRAETGACRKVPEDRDPHRPHPALPQRRGSAVIIPAQASARRAGRRPWATCSCLHRPSEPNRNPPKPDRVVWLLQHSVHSVDRLFLPHPSTQSCNR